MPKGLTPWVKASSGVKPARPGYYIASVNRAAFYRYWDGVNWHFGDYSLAKAQAIPAKLRKVWKPTWAPLNWRGLTYHEWRRARGLLKVAGK